MIKRLVLILTMINTFVFGYPCELPRAYEEVKAEDEPVQEVIVVKEEKTPEVIFLGEFRVTAYCPCYECSEGYGTQTSTGATAKEGVTIAVDPSVIPYGTDIVINGHTYKAQDTGGLIRGKRIDIYFENHATVDAFGVQYLEVYERV